MAGLAGIEPTTRGLENRCSIRMSYRPMYASVTKHDVNYTKNTTIALYRSANEESGLSGEYIA